MTINEAAEGLKREYQYRECIDRVTRRDYGVARRERAEGSETKVRQTRTCLL